MTTATPPPVLGRYECLVPLGRGGMAEVWVARVRGARGFEKLVAVKMMLPALLDDASAEGMFLDEARLASRIRHPNVTEIFDLGEEARQLFIAMEWVDGDSVAALARAVGNAPMPLAISVTIAIEAARGLHAAHELRDEAGKPVGLVHRDVSPHNVLIGRGGLVVLSDFGIAKAVGHTAHTDTGMVKGKPAYMAPEQALGAPLDRRADVFSLGVILYELTTGQHPFRGSNVAETVDRLLHRPLVKPSAVAGAHYPQELEALILRALARDPAQRLQSAEELRVGLSRVARDVVGECSTDDLAAFVQAHLGERLQARDAAIRNALANAPAVPAPVPKQAELTATALPEKPARREAGDAEVKTGATEVSLARAVAVETRQSRRWLAWSLAATAIVALGTMTWLAGTRSPAAEKINANAPPALELRQPTPDAPVPSADPSANATVSVGEAIAPAGSASASAPRRPRVAPKNQPRTPAPKGAARPPAALDTAAHIPVRNPGF